MVRSGGDVVSSHSGVGTMQHDVQVLADLYPEDGRVKVFTLPVSGSVVLAGPEIDVVDSPEFQRLAGLKQLGTSYLVFRGALHTRYEHSLGA